MLNQLSIFLVIYKIKCITIYILRWNFIAEDNLPAMSKLVTTPNKQKLCDHNHNIKNDYKCYYKQKNVNITTILTHSVSTEHWARVLAWFILKCLCVDWSWVKKILLKIYESEKYPSPNFSVCSMRTIPHNKVLIDYELRIGKNSESCSEHWDCQTEILVGPNENS